MTGLSDACERGGRGGGEREGGREGGRLITG